MVTVRLLKSGVTGAETVGGDRGVEPPFEGTLSICVGEVTPFRTRGVNLVGEPERGVALALANGT